MRKTVTYLLFVLAVLLPSSLSSQETPPAQPNNFRHHEVSIGYGFLPMPMIYDIINGGIGMALTFSYAKYEVTSFYGSVDFSYHYRFNKKFSLGISAATNGYDEKVKPGWDKNGFSPTERKRRFVSVLPVFRWNWFYHHRLSLYSEAGIGYRHERRYTNGVQSEHHGVAWQFTYLGVEYGTRLVGFAELAAGDLGSFNLGARIRF
ncbi:MAG: hypothetical protein LBL97_06065 [Prevotellaceae bacterium]|jgi:hypothetical protein|nr:hypothetical protein [Prevotellaceae bacterium]